MPKRAPQDWEILERELHAAGVSQAEIEAGARRLLAEARGHQLAEARKQLGLAQRDIAAVMGVSIARVSQIGSSTVRWSRSRSSHGTSKPWVGVLTWSLTSGIGPSGCL